MLSNTASVSHGPLWSKQSVVGPCFDRSTLFGNGTIRGQPTAAVLRNPPSHSGSHPPTHPPTHPLTAVFCTRCRNRVPLGGRSDSIITFPPSLDHPARFRRSYASKPTSFAAGQLLLLLPPPLPQLLECRVVVQRWMLISTFRRQISSLTFWF